MFFLLTNTVNGEIIYLSEQKEYKVGRKNSDILLENDQSISRLHAILRVKGDHVTLADCESKYRTFHRGDEVKPRVETKLKHRDLIQFGIFNNKFCFESYEFIVAASALSSDKKATLRLCLDTCKGKYVDKWSSKCTHLTVDTLTLTIKVLHALVDEKPIVTLDYWVEYARSIERKASLPDVNNYRPPVGEQLLRTDFEFKVDSRRKRLFNNKLFVFLKASTKEQMQDVIKSCGGSSISWEEEPKTLLDINKSPLEHLLIKTDNDEQNISFEAIIKQLDKEKKRAIPINEIALAIIHCSCDVNCNPNFNKVSKVFGGTMQKQQKRDVLAMETQSENVLPSTSAVKTEKIIPPTVDDDWVAISEMKENTNKNDGETSGTKRPNDQQEEVLPSKKLKTAEEKNRKGEEDKPTTTFLGSEKRTTSTAECGHPKDKPHSSQKRKASEDLASTSSPQSNPFSSIKVSLNKKSKTSEEANPFELTRTSKPTKPNPLKTNQNPFANIMNVKSPAPCAVKVENVMPRNEPRREIKLIPIRSSTSSDTSSTKKSFLNITWTSKSSVKRETIKEEDPELAKISEAFKDCVKVVVMPICERATITEFDASSVDVDGRKNFKKFRKVKPLKPQITIISRHEFKKIAPGDTTGIIVVNENDSDDDGPIETRIKPTAKPMGKRFVL